MLNGGDSVSVAENPCDFEHSSATSESDYVLRVKADCCSTRSITVDASGSDTVLYVFTSCPASAYSVDQVSILCVGRTAERRALAVLGVCLASLLALDMR